MASSPQFFSFFLPIFFLLMFILPSQSSPVHNLPNLLPDINDNVKVNVSLYYEALCPGSAELIKTILLDTFFRKYLYSIVNLKMVPWGNARLMQPNNTFVCQHGPDECYFNTIHACAIDVLDDKRTVFLFIVCIEQEAVKQANWDKEQVWHYCCQRHHLESKPIEDCFTSGQGKKLELGYAEETQNLNPPLNYVPWLLVEDQHIEDFQNLAAYICKAYKGKQAPEACKLVPPAVSSSAGKINSCHTAYVYSEPSSGVEQAEP